MKCKLRSSGWRTPSVAKLPTFWKHQPLLPLPPARRWRWAQERGLPTWANFVPFAIEHQQQLIPHCTPSSRTHLKGEGGSNARFPRRGREGPRAAIERGSPPLTLACRPRPRLRDRCGGGGLAHCARLQAGCYLRPHEA